MPESYLNAKSTTGTETRVLDICPTSGMCPICIEECLSLCEIGKSALRGREVLYPIPEQFGTSTQAANKDPVLEWSHFQILTELTGAYGIEADPDKAVFPAVDIETVLGGIPLKLPVITAALGSTAVAKNYWWGIAVGSAISGTMQTVGENVCGMDPDAQFTDGKVTYSKDLKFRVDTYREFWDGKHGDIAVQTNVEDQRMGVDLYALSKLEVDIIERKWGQGAKAIGGEVRVNDLDYAVMLKRRGYIVIPDPEDASVVEAFKAGAFKSFERHSRVGMITSEGFLEDIDSLREQGVKRVFLKTGAYRPEAVAFTMKMASEAKIDAVTFDGAGGGTGMSPVPMMQECSTPTVFLETQVLKCIEVLRRRGKYVPDIAMAGGFISETQIFKSIALSNLGDGPHVKTIAMARAPITAVMKATYFTELAVRNELPEEFRMSYGNKADQFLICATELKNRFGNDYYKLPPGAIGLYTYYHDRIETGLRQLMAGVRVWKLNILNRENIAALTERASKVTGIPLLEDVEQDRINMILEG